MLLLILMGLLINLYHQWHHDSACQVITNSTCVICHNRSRQPRRVMSTRGVRECRYAPYNSSYLCPALCLLGSAAQTHGADWMRNLSSSCTFVPSSTQTITDMRVRMQPKQTFPWCVLTRHNENH